MIVCFAAGVLQGFVHLSFTNKRMIKHSPSGFYSREQNLWFHQLQQIIRVLKQRGSHLTNATNSSGSQGVAADIHLSFPEN